MIVTKSRSILFTVAIVLGATAGSILRAAPPATQTFSPADAKNITTDNTRHFGDDPDDPGPLATDLSPDLSHDAVVKALKKVADWQLPRTQQYGDEIWTSGAAYIGFMAASRAIGDAKYHDAMVEMAEKFKWRPLIMRNAANAGDYQCICQTFLDLYLEKPDPQKLAGTTEILDMALSASPPTGKQIPYWWCDSLFMSPGTFARYYKATGDVKYLDYLNKNWWSCSDMLYDKSEHLYFRDSTFLNRTEANGKKMFWSRGNGWVFAGFTRVLPFLPADFVDRKKFITQFQEMAEKIAAIQSDDGLWRAGLLDPDSYMNPENSGSSFFTYGLAWGVNEGYLDRAKYTPIIAKAWKGLLSHVYADGRIGCIQQTGSNPAPFKASASYNYGVGAFMLAGAELVRFVDSPAAPQTQMITTPEVQPVTAEEAQLGKGKIIGLDYFYNHQIRNGQQFHYTWDDFDRNSGFSKFADIWRQFGAMPAKLEKAPTLADLNKFSIYIIVNPNNATKAADHKPNYILRDDIQVMTTWVSNGGVLVVFANDEKNGGCEFVHLNQLSQKFGVTFTNVLRNEVPTPNDTARGTFSAAEFPDHPLFKGVNLIFMKEIVTLSVADPAKAIFTVKKEPGESGEGKDVLIATSQFGKGLFVAICDPWFYNEYIDLSRSGFPIENRKAAMNLVRWLLPVSALPVGH